MSELDEFMEYLYSYSESDGDFLFCAQVDYAVEKFNEYKAKQKAQSKYAALIADGWKYRGLKNGKALFVKNENMEDEQYVEAD